MTSNSLTIFSVPLYFEVVRQNSSIKASLYLLAFMAPICPATVVSVAIMDRLNGAYKEITVIGYALMAVAYGLLSTVSRNAEVGAVVGYLVMAGIATGLTFQTTFIARVKQFAIIPVFAYFCPGVESNWTLPRSILEWQ